LNAHLADVFEANREHAEVSHLDEFYDVLLGNESPGLLSFEASGRFLPERVSSRNSLTGFALEMCPQTKLRRCD
jgi:hypothetical protein